MREELKPCGHCGAKAGIRIYTDSMYSAKPQDAYSVSCDDCGIETRIFLEKQEAIEAWNRRV